MAAIDPRAKVVIYYTVSDAAPGLDIHPSGLLEEKGHHFKNINITKFGAMQVMFADKSDFGFDIFSAVFYCLSRYEEYTAETKDSHGRFPHTASIFHNNNCLHIPLVDLWIQYLKRVLIEQYDMHPSVFKSTAFTITPTIDVDSVFAYKGRGVVRQLAGYGQALITANLYEVRKRFSTVTLGKTDPNDNFDFQLKALDAQGLKANYFIQVGPYGPFDKNISLKNKNFRKIIQQIAKSGHSIGVHPSYQSNSDTGKIMKEKKALEAVLQIPVTASRQHLLKYHLPHTYKALVQAGITDEYSMGYSEVPGFRAGTSHAFNWYDLENEESTNLRIHPFCAMDVAFKQFLQYDVTTTIGEIEKIKQQLKELHGNFCFVYHNESLSGHRGWQGWEKVFEACLKHED